MNIIAIIPARMGSSRFPGKPMALISGMPMIGHVYQRTRMCEGLSSVWVATCDQEIADYIESIGGRVVMTSSTHQRASDRCAEALLKIEGLMNDDVHYVAMIQGDEPLLVPEMIDDLVKPVLQDPTLETVNLINAIETEEEFDSANVVKVVLDINDYALYMSREPIPSKRKYRQVIPRWKQLGIILFCRDLLLEYTALSPTPLEVIESVDMNRLLEHGRKIKMVKTGFKSTGVDVPNDIACVEELLKKDPVIKYYMDI